jgi:hypothetical protein
MLLVTPFYGVSEMETGERERGEYLPMLLWLGLVACLVIVSGLRMGEVRWPPIVMEMLSDDGRAADLDSKTNWQLM